MACKTRSTTKAGQYALTFFSKTKQPTTTRGIDASYQSIKTLSRTPLKIENEKIYNLMKNFLNCKTLNPLPDRIDDHQYNCQWT